MDVAKWFRWYWLHVLWGLSLANPPMRRNLLLILLQKIHYLGRWVVPLGFVMTNMGLILLV